MKVKSPMTGEEEGGWGVFFGFVFCVWGEFFWQLPGKQEVIFISKTRIRVS